jgi:hypothetical protein
VTVQGIDGSQGGNADDAAFMADWRDVRADEDIQFAPVEIPPPEPPPEWLMKLQEWLETVFEPLARWLANGWPVIKWVLVAAGVLALALLIWRLIVPCLKGRGGGPEPEQLDWTPDRAAAVALLSDADALAAQGRFDEATHLLLQRSVHHIAEARPEWIDPSTTAREIARLQSLPRPAAEAFGAIAVLVERSLFALRSLKENDWQQARAAYADFALARLDGAGA